jgi:hypothetical protein
VKFLVGIGTNGIKHEAIHELPNNTIPVNHKIARFTTNRTIQLNNPAIHLSWVIWIRSNFVLEMKISSSGAAALKQDSEKIVGHTKRTQIDIRD